MGEYYIRISDEKPVDYDESLYFKLSMDDGEDEFYIIRENSYNKLVEEFNTFSNKFNEKIDDEVRNFLGTKKVEYANNTFYILDSTEKKHYSYEDIASAITDIVQLKTDRDTALPKISDIELDLDKLSSDIDALEFKPVPLEVYGFSNTVQNSGEPLYTDGDISRKVNGWKTNSDGSKSLKNGAPYHLKVFANKYFVVATIMWENAGAKIKPNYYLKDVFQATIPSEFCPMRSFSVLNGHRGGDGQNKDKQLGGRDAYLQIRFGYDGTVDFINMGTKTINESGTGYSVYCSAVWARKSSANPNSYDKNDFINLLLS